MLRDVNLNRVGWLAEVCERAEAEVATWADGFRGRPISAIQDKALLGSIDILNERLTLLRAEAARRGVL